MSSYVRRRDIEAQTIELKLERLRLEQDKLDLEKERAKNEERFLNKNFGSIIAAVVSAAAVLVSAMQVWIAFNEVPLKQQELETKVQEQKTKAAEFVMNNSKIVTVGTLDEQKLLRQVMEKSFSEDVYRPVSALMVARATSLEQAAVWYPVTGIVDSEAPQHQKVFLQYANPKDAQTLDSIGTALSSKGYEVQGKERVIQETHGDVRYFHGEDQDTASDIKKTVEDALARQGIKRELKLIPVDRYKNIPRGVFEVWLPSL